LRILIAVRRGIFERLAALIEPEKVRKELAKEG
jgi:hypothetical protein